MGGSLVGIIRSQVFFARRLFSCIDLPANQDQARGGKEWVMADSEIAASLHGSRL